MSEPYQQQPGSVLEIRPSFFPLAWVLYFCKPYYSINGSPPVAGQWKQNTVPVPAGRYQVTVWTKYLFFTTMGQSSIVVDVPAGALAVVTWRAPILVFLTGKIAVAGVGPLPAQGGPSQGGQWGGAQGSQPAQVGQAQPAFGGSPQPASQPAAHSAAQPAAQGSGGGGGAGWHPDPSGRHQHRYYDGTRWTEHVGDNGQQTTDPL